MKPMEPAEMLIRIGIGVVLIVVGIALQAAWLSAVIMLVGIAWIVWTIIRAVRQVRRAEEIQRERRARRG